MCKSVEFWRRGIDTQKHKPFRYLPNEGYYAILKRKQISAKIRLIENLAIEVLKTDRVDLTRFFPLFFLNGKLYHFFDNSELKHILCFSRALDQVFVWMTTAILHCFKPFSKLVFAYFSDDWARVNRIILKCLKLVPKLNWKYLKLKIHEYLT